MSNFLIRFFVLFRLVLRFESHLNDLFRFVLRFELPLFYSFRFVLGYRLYRFDLVTNQITKALFTQAYNVYHSFTEKDDAKINQRDKTLNPNNY